MPRKGLRLFFVFLRLEKASESSISLPRRFGADDAGFKWLWIFVKTVQLAPLPSR